MARRFVPIGPRMRSGVSDPSTGQPETFAQTQRRHAGGPSRGIFDQARVNPERFFNNASLEGMADLFDRYVNGSHVTPFELGLGRTGMTEYARQAEAYESSLPSSGKFNPMDVVRTTPNRWGIDMSPAPLSVNPTSTKNPKRPRTLAAGFEFEVGSITEGKVTIMFRDGTLYNYYDVPEATWQEFKRLASKGAFIKSSLDQYARGYASASSSSGTRLSMHKASRVAQQTLHAQRPKASGKRTVQVATHTRRRARRR